MNNKRGSSAVFLTVILAALISIAMALIYGVREVSVMSRADGVINLAGDSVMSEFNSDIQREYGLFLISGTEKELSGKLRRYIEYSLSSMGDVSVQKVSVSGSRFSIANIDMIKTQIIEYMKLAGAEDALSAGKDAAEKGNETSALTGRSLNHGPTAVSLPSAEMPKKSLTSIAESLANNISNVGNVFESGTETYLLNRYVMLHFNNRKSIVNEKHFFRSEAEYILGGELSDDKNEKRVESAIKALRFPLNLAHIYEDEKKRSATLTLAEVLTPGAAAATQAVLAATWAYVESDNDVELLCKGYKVPMMKDESSWAIDLDSAVEGIFGDTVIPDEEKGYDYGEYLQMLLFFQDENTKINRMLDLIQVNMRAEYDGDFLINECALGISIDVRVNGKDYEYEKKY